MELKQLQYFVVSVDMGSFQNAAKMLYTTQPHVSKTVKALEEELHLKLLNREARGVKMTAEGKKVYDYALVRPAHDWNDRAPVDGGLLPEGGGEHERRNLHADDLPRSDAVPHEGRAHEGGGLRLRLRAGPFAEDAC